MTPRRTHPSHNQFDSQDDLDRWIDDMEDEDDAEAQGADDDWSEFGDEEPDR